MGIFSWLKLFTVCRRYREGHVDVQRRAQINFMLLLLHNDRAQGFAQRKFPHRLGLPNFTDGNIRGGNPTLTGCEVRHWQMTIKIGFTVKE